MHLPRTLAVALLMLGALGFVGERTTRATPTSPVSGPPGLLDTFAGGGAGGDGSPAREASVLPYRVLMSASGELYMSEFGCQIRKISGGVVVHVAGTPGSCGAAGDGGPASVAQLMRPVGLAWDATGNLLIADSFNCAIRRLDFASQTLSTVAGTLHTCAVPILNNVPPLNVVFSNPDAVAVNSEGDLYVGDTRNCRIMKVTGGLISMVAGAGKPVAGAPCIDDGDGGLATLAHISDTEPQDMTITANGDVYFNSGCSIRKISQGLISTVAGGQPNCNGSSAADGAATALRVSPISLASDSAGRIFFGDWRDSSPGSGWLCRIRVLSDGFISTLAGSPGADAACAGTVDGGLAKGSPIMSPAGITLDSAGNLYFSELDPNGPYAPRVRVIYGADADTDGDGYMDAAEATVGKDWRQYCDVMRADIKQDGRINSIDMARAADLLSPKVSTGRADQNGDKYTNSIDLAIIASHFSQSIAGCA